jgi:photosystem II stability/assembly factor-like uncharacterized protein
VSPRRLLQVILLAALATASAVQAASLADPLDRPALMSPLAPRAAMLDLTRAGSRVVAVGERGIVLLSDDAGRNWRQAAVPASVSLTAVAFADDHVGWAVGHGAIVLKTEDGGEHWMRQLDGRQIAERMAGSATQSEAAAQRWLREGADKPLLSLQVSDAQSLRIVGAFGLAFRSRDGGKSWEYFGDKLDNPMANHLYAIAAQGEQVVIAGERGSLFASNDGGASFKRLGVPYKGSLFRLQPTGRGLFAAGMNGKLLFTADLGRTWKDVANPIPASLLGAGAAAEGKLLWLNQAGQLLLGGEDAQALIPLQGQAAEGATRILLNGNKQLVTAGFRGVAAQPWNP